MNEKRCRVVYWVERNGSHLGLNWMDMMKHFYWVIGFVLLAGIHAEGAGKVRVEQSGEIVIGRDGLPDRTFAPRFVVLYAEKAPKLTVRLGRFADEHLKAMYNIETWEPAGSSKKKAASKGQVADGFDPSLDKEASADATSNLFKAGRLIQPAFTAAINENGKVMWTFAEQPEFSLTAEVVIGDGDAAPKLTFHLHPKVAGAFSVGYLGAPGASIKEVEEIWQPMIWQEKRFPDDSYLTAAFRCTVPTTLVTQGGVSVGVVADPVELPFQPLPRMENSRFGVAVRNHSGQAQPMLFAPILGGKDSVMQAGSKFDFTVHLLAHPGRCVDAYQHIAKSIYGFHDYRENAFNSLNVTLERMIEYGLSDYSRFNAELRGCAYDTDMAGSVKNISSLHPLGMAMVTDDRRIFIERARPMMEYALSREKFLFTTKLGEKGSQSASSMLNGPGGQVSEFAALYAMSRKSTPTFLSAAMELFGKTRVLNLDAPVPGKIWPNALAIYRATGEQKWLDLAKNGADEYIDRRIKTVQTDYADPDSRGMFFWTSYAPHWAELQMLYEETGVQKYLDAAVVGAHRFSQFIWMCPRISDEEILVNEGGLAPQYRAGKKRIHIPEEKAPEWRLSEIGLTPESAPTCKGHRAIFLACHAPWMMRLGYLANDDFLHDIARSAVVGRYTNFPGYHINTARTTVYEKPEFPRRSMDELNSTTSLHYNHPWAQIAMLLDYLVSDAAYRSRGQLSFPGRYAEGYAYVQCQVYGDRPGTVYGEKDAWLWMPKSLVQIDNIQVNYLAARGDNRLYLMLTNQSGKDEEAHLTLNGQLVALAPENRVRIWKENAPATPTTMKDGKTSVAIKAGGITVLCVEDVKIQPKFQTEILAASRPMSNKSEVELKFGQTKGMLLSFGDDLTSAYIYTKATYQVLKKVTLHYRSGSEWKTMTDDAYPFEFTVPLARGDQRLEFYLEAERTKGGNDKSETAVLEK